MSWRRLQKTKTKDVFKMSSRRLNQDECLLGFNLITRLKNILKTSWKRLEDILVRRLEDILKTFSRCLENLLKTSWRRMAKTNILVLTKTFWRRLEDVFWRRMTKENIFVLIKTSWKRLLKTKTKDIFKTSSRMFGGLRVSFNFSNRVFFIGM